ncbi:chromosomal replication initiator protein [Rhodopseudomonas rhenobacensis]|uniref:Chromosomal replication initiator protein n=1 Tax=Rhodopseudomonas rhenobacensis TaxID=87461 RepID=A0A7W8DZC7_9BRAD|nr:helix-turn-helix domain-containing protein [Rhodopseudomonas rhenobacensis]MBB5046761.1 chromosomal replication initiator protein [Rhodopseudomonas rhenobacensis]
MQPRVSVNMILQATSVVFGVSVIEMRSHRHHEVVVRARFAACLLCRELTDHSFPMLGRSIGLRDHTTILRAVRRAEQMRASDAEFAQCYEEAKAAILFVSGTKLADLLRDDDAVEVAVRILDAPNSAPVRVSTREIIAMAVRLITLEELAISNLELLTTLDVLAETQSETEAQALRAEAALLIDGIATSLGSLGLANASIPSAPKGDLHA